MIQPFFIKNFRSFFFSLAILLLVFPSCTSSRGILSTGKSAKTAMQTAKANNLKFRTLSIKGQARAQMPEQKFEIGINYKIDMAHDSLIRIRVTKLGLEGARILITPDSIFVLDRLNKQARKYDLGIAQKFTGLQADFALIQAMLLGDTHPIPEQLQLKDRRIKPWVFQGEAAGTLFSYKISPERLKLVGLEAINAEKSQHSELLYHAFESFDKQWMATEGEVKVKEPSQAGFSFKHNKVEINPSKVSFRFNIPNNYEILAD
jgi:hypothetical protein